MVSDSQKLKDPPDLSLTSSMDTAETNATATTADSTDSKTLPKTCFPAAYPKNYPKRLTTSSDQTKLNLLHCFIRSELLELFVVEKSNDDVKFRYAPSSSVGRVGLRCVHCALRRNRSFEECPDDEAPMSVFYPKAIKEIYRLVTSWQRCHLRKCRNLPPTVRHRWDELRLSDKSRGKTGYWTESALMIGLRDCPSRAGGMRFDVALVEAQQDAAAAVGDTERMTRVTTERMVLALAATETVTTISNAEVSTPSEDCTTTEKNALGSSKGSDETDLAAEAVRQETEDL